MPAAATCTKLTHSPLARLRPSGLIATTDTRHYALSLSLATRDDKLQSNWNSKLALQALSLPLEQPRHVRSLNQAERAAETPLPRSWNLKQQPGLRNQRGPFEARKRAKQERRNAGNQASNGTSEQSRFPPLPRNRNLTKTWKHSPVLSGPFEAGKSAK